LANCGHTGGLVQPHFVLSPSGKTRYPLGVYDGRVQCPAGLVVIDPTYRPAVRPFARPPAPHAVLVPHPTRDHTTLAITQKQHTNATATTLAKTHTHWGSKCLFCHTGNVLVFVCLPPPTCLPQSNGSKVISLPRQILTVCQYIRDILSIYVECISARTVEGRENSWADFAYKTK
jgi:hypothetical protein